MNVHHFILISLNFYINIVKCEFVIESIGWNSLDERVFSTNLQPIIEYGLPTICDERCGLPYNGGNLRIMGGVETKPNQLPWMAFLKIVSAGQFKMDQTICGATLIKNKFLLTAAHCMFHTKIVSVTAHIGFHHLDPKFDKTGHEIVLPVVRALVHEAFDPVTMQNDIAVLELSRPIRFTDQIHSICLMQNEMSVTNGVIAGWGVTQVFGTMFYPKTLLYGSVPIIDLRKCQRILTQDIKFITSQNICAGGQSTDTCWGDSGGPLMWTRNSNFPRYNQIGVTSWGRECAGEGIPAIYTKISSYFSWIQYVTRDDNCVPISPR